MDDIQEHYLQCRCDNITGDNEERCASYAVKRVMEPPDIDLNLCEEHYQTLYGGIDVVVFNIPLSN